MTTEARGRGLSLYDAARAMGVPFESDALPQDKYVDANDMKFHYLEWGDPSSPPLMRLHGFAQTCHSWDFVALSLCDRYRVIVLDQRGHGDSDWAPDGDYSLEAQVGDLDGFVKAQGFGPFVLMGHSMGGRNSYVWASRNSELLRGLVLVDTGPDTQRAGRNRIKTFRELPDELDSFEEFSRRIQEYTGRSQVQVEGALQYSIRQRQDGKWTWKYDKVMRDPSSRESGWEPEQLWECVSRINCPTLVMRGPSHKPLRPLKCGGSSFRLKYGATVLRPVVNSSSRI